MRVIAALRRFTRVNVASTFQTVEGREQRARIYLEHFDTDLHESDGYSVSMHQSPLDDLDVAPLIPIVKRKKLHGSRLCFPPYARRENLLVRNGGTRLSWRLLLTVYKADATVL
jgi:hypothetical protein